MIFRTTVSMNNKELSSFFDNFRQNDGTDPLPISGFEVEKYLGVWHELARTKNPFEAKNSTNIVAEYGLLENGNVSVKNTSIVNGKSRGGTGEAKFVGSRDVADLEVNFGKNPFSKLFMKGRYKVVKTDYENYAFLFTRQKIFFFFNTVYAWILVRNPNLNPDEKEQLINDFLEVTHLDRKDLIFPTNN